MQTLLPLYYFFHESFVIINAARKIKWFHYFKEKIKIKLPARFAASPHHGTGFIV